MIPFVELPVENSVLNLALGPLSESWGTKVVLLTNEHGNWGGNDSKVDAWGIFSTISLHVLFNTVVILLEI